MPLDAAQRGVARGAAAAAVWTAGLYVAGPALLHPDGAALPLVAAWLVLPALTLVAAVGRVANARFYDPGIIHGQDPRAGTPADRAQRILRNTAEQCLLAALVWPALAVQLDPARLGLVPRSPAASSSAASPLRQATHAGRRAAPSASARPFIPPWRRRSGRPSCWWPDGLPRAPGFPAPAGHGLVRPAARAHRVRPRAARRPEPAAAEAGR